MFFAVTGYKHETNTINNRVYVFDTDDCTVEIVSMEDIREYDINIKNLYIFKTGGLTTSTGFTAMLGGVFVRSDVFAINFDNKNVNIFAYGCHINVGFEKRKTLVNGKVLKNDDYGMVLVYLFKFKDYIVLRFVDTFLRKDCEVPLWYSVAVSIKTEDIAAEWRSDMVVVENSTLAVQIDTVSEV